MARVCQVFGSDALSVVDGACRRLGQGFGLMKIDHDRCGVRDRDGLFGVGGVDDRRDRGCRRGDRGSRLHSWRRGAVPDVRDPHAARACIPRVGAGGRPDRWAACAGSCPRSTDALSCAALRAADVPRTDPWCAGTLSTPHGAAQRTTAQRRERARRSRLGPVTTRDGNRRGQGRGPACIVGHRAARPSRAASVGDRRLRVTAQPVRHGVDRRRDRCPDRCAARPWRRSGHGLAAWPSRSRHRVPLRVKHLRPGDQKRLAERGSGGRPVASVARPGRSRSQRGRRPLSVLGWRDRCPGRAAGPHHNRALASSARAAQAGSRAAGVLPAAEPVAEHRQTLCPRQRTDSSATRAQIPAHARGSLPGPSAVATR